MSKDNVLALRENPGIAGEVSDVLTQVLRAGAQQDVSASDRSRGCGISRTLSLLPIGIKRGGRAWYAMGTCRHG